MVRPPRITGVAKCPLEQHVLWIDAGGFMLMMMADVL